MENDALVRSMREQYGVDDAAAGLRECLMTRRAGVSDAAAPKRLYYVSGGAKKLLAADGGGAGGLQVVSAGVMAVERQAAKGAACEYRVTQEGLDVLLPHLERQVVRAAPREIEAILARQQGQPQSAEAAKQDLLRPVDAPEGCWEKETLEAMKRVTPGCVVLVTRATREEGGGDEQPAKRAKKEKKEKKEKKDRRVRPGVVRGGGPGDLAVACWVGEGEKGKSLSVLASKAEGGHLLHQLREFLDEA